MQTRLGLNLALLFADLSAPFLPDASKTISAAFGNQESAWPEDIALSLETLAPGHKFDVPEVLFAKISNEQTEEWKAKFSGQ